MKKKLLSLLIPLIAISFLSGQLSAQTDINGLVLYHFKSNKPIPSVNMSLVDSNGIEFATTTTALNGTYNFAGVPDGTYTLKASTEISAGGITMGDAFLMLLHLCNIYPFSPIQKLAADVDGNGAVTWNDYFTVIIGWFIQGYPFPAGPWAFQDITFTLTGSKTSLPTMGGSSSGDVNGTFVPATREMAAINATYTEKKASNDFSIEIFANDIAEASAMGMVINYPASMVEIKDVNSQLGETNMSIENGQIRLNWINQSNSAVAVDSGLPILVINATTNDTYNGSDIRFEIDPVSHFSNLKGEQIDTRYTLPLITNQGSYLYSNYPNPFNGSTNITYALPSDSKVNISLYNQQGQLVRVITEAFEIAGVHHCQFDSNGLEAGIYYYTLKTNGLKSINETKRMIITR